MIQLFARTMDLIPRDPPKLLYLGWFNDPDEGKPFYNDTTTLIDKESYWDCFKYFLEDIKQNGIKYAIKINHQGVIQDGDCRYWIARVLNLEYVPIQYMDTSKKQKVRPAKKLDWKYTEDQKNFYLEKPKCPEE